MHESKGIKFHMNAAVESAEATSGRSDHVGAVKLKDGTIIPADVVIMAVGIGPATQFLKESGFRLERDGGVSVDKYMQVKGVKDVYATGQKYVVSSFLIVRRYRCLPLCSTEQQAHQN